MTTDRKVLHLAMVNVQLLAALRSVNDSLEDCIKVLPTEAAKEAARRMVDLTRQIIAISEEG